jgi:aryl-alcohol dehydrogenase-like predicted oxidoreductase
VLQSADLPEIPGQPMRDADAGDCDAGRRRLLAACAAAPLVMPAPAARAAALEQRRFGRADERVPVIGLGTWQTFDVGDDPAARDAARSVLDAFQRGGGRVVDTSPMYGTAEATLGELASALGVRARLFVATKVWTTGRAAGERQLERSLALSRGAALDLVQVHNLLDLDTHLATLHAWKADGRVRHVGASHYHAGAHADLVRVVESGRVDAVQVNYSLAERAAAERVLPAAAQHGVAVLVNRPFAEGALFGRVRGVALPAWATAELGATSFAQLFLKFILAESAVTVVLPATRNPRHLADNLAAGRGPLPTAAQRKRIAAWFDAL